MAMNYLGGNSYNPFEDRYEYEKMVRMKEKEMQYREMQKLAQQMHAQAPETKTQAPKPAAHLNKKLLLTKGIA